MGIPEGDYSIISALGENIHIGFLDRVPGPVLQVRGIVNKSYIWHIKPFGNPGSNLSTVTLRGGVPYKLIVKDDKLFASLSDPPTPFSIETTGGGKVRFHVPNKDAVWELPALNNQIVITKADGSNNQQWELARIIGDEAEPASES